jgi:hypothetical protein
MFWRNVAYSKLPCRSSTGIASARVRSWLMRAASSCWNTDARWSTAIRAKVLAARAAQDGRDDDPFTLTMSACESGLIEMDAFPHSEPSALVAAS